MREIKFRVWNLSTKEFMSIENGLGTHFDYSDEHGLQGKEGIVLMQFTGLKDKEGKEIYEGDIVEVYFQMNPSDKMATYLEFIEDIRHIPRIGGSSRECKVIGNIHENPELLK